ncbi:hypothetical protein BX265_3775 [Streptomyces sp. TLI_235]|nr:hypothetical protein BX265_3775 [Streptomyces sp. TLI_235]
MDILTDAVASVRTGNPVSARTDCRAPWGLRFAEQSGAGFHVVLSGTCWLIEPGGATTRLGPGDIIFVRSGREHVLADDPGSPVVDYRIDRSWPVSPVRRPAQPGTGPVTSLLCGSYHLDQERPHPLVATLPPLIHLPARRGRHTALTAAIDLLAAELEQPGPGSDGIVAQLIDLLLLYILRAWPDEQPDAAAAGWAAALRDPAIAPALKAIHAAPGDAWTVESLGDSVGLSRGRLRPPLHRPGRRAPAGLPHPLADDHRDRPAAALRHPDIGGRRPGRLQLRVRLRQGLQARVRAAAGPVPAPRPRGRLTRDGTAAGTVGQHAEARGRGAYGRSATDTDAMRQNPENPEFPEDYDEESPAVMEAEDEEREVAERQGDELEQLRERRALGADEADDGDAVEQALVASLDDEDDYRD